MEFKTVDYTGKEIKVTTVPTPTCYMRAGEALMEQMKAEQDRRKEAEALRWNGLSLRQKARERLAELFA